MRISDNIFQLFFFFLSVVYGASNALAQQTYYVSPSGKDTNAGTNAVPWLTLQKAANSVVAGDTVIVRAGTYAGFVVGWDFTTSGTANAPITFHGETGAIINARNGKTADGINLEGQCHYFIIEGFTVNNAAGSITRAGIRVVESDHVIIRNNVTDKNGTWGIFSSFSNDLLIENNTTSNSGSQHGIYTSNSGDRPILRKNTSFGNYGCGIHMNGDLSMGGDGIISGALVENNIVYDNGRGGGSGINGDGVQDSIIRNNILYNNHASGISLFQIDGGGGPTNNIVVNNTILQAADGRWALNISSAGNGNTIFNNILYNSHSWKGSITTTPESAALLKSDYNIVLDRFTTDDGGTVLTLAQWRAATGQDTHSMIAAPAALFMNAASNDYHLVSTSPALDKGVAMFNSLAAPTLDFEGNPRPAGAGFDIGADEVFNENSDKLSPAAPSRLRVQ